MKTENNKNKNRSESGNSEGIAKGYRLKPETHDLVSILQKQINGTKEDVISRACGMLNEEITKQIDNKNRK